MRREDCMEMFERIPEGMHAAGEPGPAKQLRALSVDMVARFEETYVVFRGREGGTSDEGRGFFVPYDEISYIRIERPVRVGELKMMYGETGYQDAEDRLDAETQAFEAAKRGQAAVDADAGRDPGAGRRPRRRLDGESDPASIARQNLLDRIRAARANVAGTTGKLGGK